MTLFITLLSLEKDHLQFLLYQHTDQASCREAHDAELQIFILLPAFFSG